MAQRFLPILAGVATLLFGGYFERFLSDDAAGHYLGLYLFVMASTTCIITLVSFSGAPREILRKTVVFPTTPWMRFVFVSIAGARSPVMVAFWLAGSFSIGVLTEGGVAARALGVAHFSLLVFFSLVTTTCLLQAMARLKTGPLPLAVVFMLGLPAMLIMTVVFGLHWEYSVPFLSWIRVGIRSAAAGDIDTAVRLLLYAAGVSVLPVLVGRKVS